MDTTMPDLFARITEFIKALYPNQSPIPLHEPRFIGNEKKYLNQCIESTYVSYLGEFVGRFENMIQEFTGAKYAIASANGTLALHAALLLAGVKPGDEALTQALTFVATANSIMHCGAKPIFIDSEKKTFGMSPENLEEFLARETIIKDDGFCYNKDTGRKISTCIPMHVFGHPVRIDEILNICNKYNITVIEDAAESLGSFYKNKHTGTFGKIGILSFNGNKTITTGGGGMIITDNENIAKQAKHLTSTAKVPHEWEFIHDEVGYNYRMPNVNAAIGCAQMESLPKYLDNKRETAALYKEFFDGLGVQFLVEAVESRSNYWLNAIILADREQREEFLDYSHKNGIMIRPIWRLMNKLQMYKDCQHTNLETAQWLEDRVVNIPSSVRV